MRHRPDPILLVLLEINRPLQLVLLSLQLEQLLPIGLLKVHLLPLHQLSSLSFLLFAQNHVLLLNLLSKLVLADQEVFLQVAKLAFFFELEGLDLFLELVEFVLHFDLPFVVEGGFFFHGTLAFSQHKLLLHPPLLILQLPLLAGQSVLLLLLLLPVINLILQLSASILPLPQTHQIHDS